MSSFEQNNIEQNRAYNEPSNDKLVEFLRNDCYAPRSNSEAHPVNSETKLSGGDTLSKSDWTSFDAGCQTQKHKETVSLTNGDKISVFSSSDSTVIGHPTNGWSLQTAAGLKIESNYGRLNEGLTISYPNGSSVKIPTPEPSSKELEITQKGKKPILISNLENGVVQIKDGDKTVELNVGAPFKNGKILSVDGHKLDSERVRHPLN